MNSQPKFSILPLPGDDWETRRTKEIIRNMVRIKDMQGFTTQQVVDRCNQFLAVENKIKMSTLNGLFAGKRKSVTIAELEMFAAALDVPVLGLLYPPQEKAVEIRPGHEVTPEYGIRNAAAIWAFGDGESPMELERSISSRHDPVSQGVFGVVRTWFDAWDFQDAMLRVFEAIDNGESDATISHLVSSAIPAIWNLHHARRRLRDINIEPTPLPHFYRWVDSSDPSGMSIDTVRAYHSMWAEAREEYKKTLPESVELDRKWLTERKNKANNRAQTS